jgi:hypothetical protein
VSYLAVTSQPAETDLQKWRNAGTCDARAVPCWHGHADRHVGLARCSTSMTGCATRDSQRTKAGSRIVKAGPRFPLAPPRSRPRLHESAAGFVPAQVPHRQYYSCRINEKVTGVEPDFEKLIGFKGRCGIQRATGYLNAKPFPIMKAAGPRPLAGRGSARRSTNAVHSSEPPAKPRRTRDE